MPYKVVTELQKERCKLIKEILGKLGTSRLGEVTVSWLVLCCEQWRKYAQKICFLLHVDLSWGLMFISVGTISHTAVPRVLRRDAEYYKKLEDAGFRLDFGRLPLKIFVGKLLVQSSSVQRCHNRGSSYISKFQEHETPIAISKPD